MTSPLDPAVLATLREVEADGAQGFVSTMAAAFLDDATSQLAQLREAIAERRSAAIKQTAHSLKGMCGTMGAMNMSAISAELERSGDAVDRHKALCEALEREFAAVERELQQLIAS